MKGKLAALALMLPLLSCTPVFQATQGKLDTKGKTIALVCGTPFASTDMLASALSDELVLHTRFRVLPYANVKRITGEKQRVPGPYSNAYIEIDENFALTDVSVINMVHEKTGADFVFVLWTPVELKDIVTPYRGHTALEPVTVESVHVVCQLYEFPGPVEKGHGKAVLEYLSENTGKDQVKINGKFVHPSGRSAFTEWSSEVAEQVTLGPGI